MARRGHVPQRTCAGCGGRFDKKTLVRFTVMAGPKGRRPVIDTGGRGQGRGAYLCPRAECYTRAMKRNALGSRLRAERPGDELEREFIEHITSSGIRNGEEESLRNSQGE